MSIPEINSDARPQVVDSLGNLRKPVPDSADARPSGRQAAKVFHKKTLDVNAAPALDKELFDSAVDDIKKFLAQNKKNELAVHVDQLMNRPIVRVIDPNRGEILQIPGEHILTVARNIESLRGVLFDKKA
jgi:uncharacterized FlaG/YvyC family protein